MSRKGRTWRLKERKKQCINVCGCRNPQQAPQGESGCVQDDRGVNIYDMYVMSSHASECQISARKLLLDDCESKEVFIQLCRWMKTCGFENAKCSLTPAKFPGTGRGMMATRNIASGAVIIAIAKELLITTETVLKSYLGTHITCWEPRLTPVECLCVFLICEQARGRNSPWHSYIQFLPDTYTNVAYWSKEELEWLPVTCQEKAQEHILRLEKSYSCVYYFFKQLEVIFPHFQKVCDKDAYRWAWSTVNTRCVYMKQCPSPFLSLGEEDHYALAPMLDLLNHSTMAQVDAGFNLKTQCYEIRTMIPYHSFEQVFISYGPHDNSKLLVEYGFLIPDNPHEVYIFHLDDLQDLCSRLQLPETALKLTILVDQGLHIGLSCSIEGLSWKLATALRLLAMDPDKLKTGWQGVLYGTVSEQNEKEMKRLATTLLQEKVHKFPNKEAGDITSLHKKMAFDLCQQQMDILLHTLNQVTRQHEDVQPDD